MKRYNCYTEKNNYSDSIEVDIFRKRDSDVPEVIMKRRQQDARAKRCSTEKRHQEAQAMAAQDAEARRQQDAKAKRR